MRSLVVLCATLMLGAGSALADTIFVSPSPTLGAMGTSWDDPIGFIEAFAKAVSGDEIWMAKGVYEVTVSEIAFTNGVRVYGGFSGIEKLRELRDWLRERTILQAVQQDVIMSMTDCDSSSRIDGLHFRGAPVTALVVSGGDPRIFNCHFRGNGGTQPEGGAIKATNVGRIRIEYCVFDSNQAALKGGAVYIASSKVDPKNFGPFIGQSFFVANNASHGGALYMGDCAGTPQVVSSVFANNEANDAGGAIASVGTNLYMNNCTFSRNTLAAGYAFGGRTIAIQGGLLQNSVVWNGVEEDTAAHIYKFTPANDTMRITATANIVEADFELGFWQVDPQFENADLPSGRDLLYGTDDDGLVPGPFSLARDGGFIDRFVNHRQQDILGNPRLVGRKIDIGAYESQRAGRVPQLELMEEMRQGKLVFMFRHAKTDWDQRDRGPAPECFPGRNLIAEGREQSVSIGAHQRALGVPQGEALSSPVCRCWETLDLMVGRHQKASQWASGGSPQAVTNRLNDLKTPPTTGCRNVSTHDAVAVFVFNRDGGGETLTTAELMEGDCIVVRPLVDTMEVLAHWCSDTWERWWIKYNPNALVSVHDKTPSVRTVSVYPNPATGVVMIEVPGAADVQNLLVYNLMGNPVWRGTFIDKVRLDVSGWAPGVYAAIAGSVRTLFVVR
jgi:hypothetical protein